MAVLDEVTGLDPAALRFLVMNVLGGICWLLLVGGGAYLVGDQINRVAGPVSLALLVVAICLLVVGVIYFRRREKELARRAERAIPGPPLKARRRCL
jgi:membrane protein DedA with SNARE-associated domain